MSTSEPNSDHTPQTEPQEAPAESGAEQPAQKPGFWQEPTEPMERAHQPIHERRSQKDQK